MDTQLSETLETNSLPPDSIISPKISSPPRDLAIVSETLNGSSSILPETLDGSSSILPETLDGSSSILPETLEFNSPSLDSTNVGAIAESLPNSDVFAPPTQTLDGSSPILPKTLEIESLDLTISKESLDGSYPNVESSTGRSSDFDNLGDTRSYLPTCDTIKDDGPSFSLMGEDEDMFDIGKDDDPYEKDDDPSPLPLALYRDPYFDNRFYNRHSRYNRYDRHNQYDRYNRGFHWSPSPIRDAESDPLMNFSHFHTEVIEPALVGAGLANLGNTCFLNAVLQCFTHTVPLVQGLRCLNHVAPFDCCNAEFCVICALREHVELCMSSSGSIVSPWTMVSNLRYISDDFQRYRQEDAHEFLQRMLERLGDSFPVVKTLFNNNVSEDDNLVNHIFGGRLISKLRCCNCGHESETYEPLVDLSLEIEEVESLPSALQSFTKLEKMEDPENMFTCENCKKQVSLEKQLMIDSVPSIAAFHLKRFKNDGVVVEKIDKFVEYPLELDLKPFTSCNQEDDVKMKYELYAVVVHAGVSSASGHYFCFARSSPDTWHKLDDSKVFRVREEQVLHQDAYILFYAKHGTPWFSSLMEANKACLDRNMSSTSPKSVLESVVNKSLECPITENLYNCKVRENNDDDDDMDVIVTDLCSESKLGDDTVLPRNDASTSYTETPFVMNDSYEKPKPSPKFVKTCYVSPVRVSCDPIDEVSVNAKILPQTPPRILSPNIYDLDQESPEVVFQISRDNLKSAEKSCKKQLNKTIEDSERKEALRFAMKRMPTSRSAQLIAAMRRSPVKKNNRRKTVSPYSKLSPKSLRKQGHQNDLRPVAAAVSH